MHAEHLLLSPGARVPGCMQLSVDRPRVCTVAHLGHNKITAIGGFKAWLAVQDRLPLADAAGGARRLRGAAETWQQAWCWLTFIDTRLARERVTRSRRRRQC